MVSNPTGTVAEWSLSVPGAHSVRLGYATDGLTAHAELAEGALNVVQAPGSVVAVHTDADQGPRPWGVDPVTPS